MNRDDPEVLLQPAHSVEAERSVLGAILIDNDAFDRVADKLTEGDFFVLSHRQLFAAMAAMLRDSKTVDLVTLTAEMDARRQLEAIGGIQAIGGIASEVPTAQNVELYANIVRARSRSRALLAASWKLGELAHDRSRTPDDAIAEGEAVLARLAESHADADAQPVGAYLTEIADEIERRMMRDGDGVQGLATGLADLDEKLCGLQPDDLVLIAARPSIGKTALGLQIAQTAALAGKTALVFSLEMPRKKLIERMLSNIGHVNSHALRNGRLARGDWDGISAAMGRLLDAKLIIDDATPMTVTQMRARARRTHRKHGLDLIVIDYIGLVDGEKGEKRHEEVSDISRRLKGIARELHIPVVALVQLNRKTEDRTGNRPKLSDLRESGALEQDADVVMLLYRDEYYNEDSDWKGTAEINIAKQRNGETGMVRTAFRGEYSRFDDLSHDYQRPTPSIGPRNTRKRKGMDE